MYSCDDVIQAVADFIINDTLKDCQLRKKKDILEYFVNQFTVENLREVLHCDEERLQSISDFSLAFWKKYGKEEMFTFCCGEPVFWAYEKLGNGAIETQMCYTEILVNLLNCDDEIFYITVDSYEWFLK